MADFVSDTFTDTAGTAITAHTGETGATWTRHASSSGGTATPALEINASGKLVTTQNNVNQNFYASGSPASADYTVTLDWTFLGSTTEEIVGPLARLDPAANTHYGFYFVSGLAQFILQKKVAGANTNLGTWVNHTRITNETYRMTIDVSGSSTTTINCRVQRLSDNNWLTTSGTWQSGQVNCISTTDSSSPVTAAGKAGVLMLCQVGSGTRGTVDNFVANEAGGGGGGGTVPLNILMPHQGIFLRR